MYVAIALLKHCYKSGGSTGNYGHKSHRPCEISLLTKHRMSTKKNEERAPEEFSTFLSPLKVMMRKGSEIVLRECAKLKQTMPAALYEF